jgi:hypothetical protein
MNCLDASARNLGRLGIECTNCLNAVARTSAAPTTYNPKSEARERDGRTSLSHSSRSLITVYRGRVPLGPPT